MNECANNSTVMPRLGGTADRISMLRIRILLDMSMLEPVLPDALSAGGVVVDGCADSGRVYCSSAYVSVMALVQVFYRERAGWTEQGGESIKSFFKSKSNLVRDGES